ncbi:E3 SUMO-protein ligase Nse2 (Mms21) [Kalmanozyma brasiliensis GHG001]|uniref:SP-RING-type domain-containing protein n=1 Tax=Kalmanozyma brasiliensis (strain GHG001) TaxID=1365824 RepID=V5E8Q3_KALBG|nr:E3 SUMO-protein ligase Nse2 (Mms21) [Kalmanozyma brasiliensis GHG001]EST06701.1 E3 SUMO-protein ligase Nse2 (Mms21) [Kalmanozyma brasiliensis GHG001]
MPSASRRRRVDDSDEEAENVAPPSQRRSQGRSNFDASSSSTAEPSTSRAAAAVDTEELRPQPLVREHVPNIRGLTAELKTSDTMLNKCIELLNETAEQVAEAFRAHDDCRELDQADADLRELIDAQAEKAIRRKVLDDIAQDLHTGQQLDDPAKRYKEDVQSALDAYTKQTSRKKYAKNTDYHNLKNIVWVAKEEGAMPPVSDLIPAEPGDEDNNDSDDDIQTGGAVINFRCPLTANILEDPLSNSNCTHSYSRSAIEDYVARGNNRCPAASCMAAVGPRTLKQDQALVKKVAAFKRREEERLIARRQTSTVLY